MEKFVNLSLNKNGLLSHNSCLNNLSEIQTAIMTQERIKYLLTIAVCVNRGVNRKKRFHKSG